MPEKTKRILIFKINKGDSMIRFLFNSKCSLLFLCIFVLPVYAQEWVPVSTNEKLTTYIDIASIKKVEGFSRAWTIQDWKVADKYGVYSYRALQEFDCKNIRMRTLNMTAHTGHLATGDILTIISTPSEWVYSPPGTISHVNHDFVCSK